MAVGLQIFNASGSLLFDSTTAVGGVFADTRTYAPGATASLTYPVFAGRTAVVTPGAQGGDAGVSVDTALGYPRVTVGSAPTTRYFSVIVT